MGCASVKTHSKPKSQQKLIQLPPGLSQFTCPTEPDVTDLQENYLQIGLLITSLGELHPAVKETFNQVGTLFPQLDQGQFEYTMMTDGSKFYGQMWMGRRHGFGRQHWQQEGNYLEGIWVEDSLTGRARMIYPNGDYFEGGFINNLANGQGRFVNSKKEVSGVWLQNKLNGNGQEIRHNGTIYNGQFVDGKINGFGTFKWANGCVYKGEVSKGKMHGHGTLTFPDLSSYTGEFKFSNIQGKGVYVSQGTNQDGWFHSKYEHQVLKLYYFESAAVILIQEKVCSMTTKQLQSFFE